MEGSERVLGPDHPGTLTSVGNLASLLKAQGKLQEAEPLYRCEGCGRCWLKCGSDVRRRGLEPAAGGLVG